MAGFMWESMILVFGNLKVDSGNGSHILCWKMVWPAHSIMVGCLGVDFFRGRFGSRDDNIITNTLGKCFVIPILRDNFHWR
jgi:hypothetical protein